MKRLIMALLVAGLFLYAPISYGQPNFLRVPRDSIDLGDYKAILYEIYIPIGDTSEKNSEELYISKDDKPAMTTKSITVSMFNFGTEDSTSEGKYYKDINNDGIDEIIVMGHTGLGSCCMHVSIHGLNEEFISDLGRQELKDLDVFYFEDIDNDSIPEILHGDPHFLRWKAPFDDSPRPLLIWKWHEGGYRLANFKHADYLLGKITDDDYKLLEKAIARRVEKEYNPDHEYYKYPPPALWDLMLDYIYAGESGKADSLFEEYWPEQIPGKEVFYGEFKNHLENGLYWQGITNSSF